jgi:hypothetical protein
MSNQSSDTEDESRARILYFGSGTIQSDHPNVGLCFPFTGTPAPEWLTRFSEGRTI